MIQSLYQLEEILFEIESVDHNIMVKAQNRLDNLTKPKGSLGKLETLAVRICGIRKRLDVAVNRKIILTFAADHDFVPAELSPGGGLGVPYTPEEPAPSAKEWITAVGQTVMEECRARDWPLPRLVLEPGRWLIAAR